MDYVYYHFKTDGQAAAWCTAEITEYLRSFDFLVHKSGGEYVSQQPFLSISLMNVRDGNSWRSSRDFDPEKTNYIAIVTSTEWYWGITKDPQIQTVLKGLEQLLHSEICEDW